MVLLSGIWYYSLPQVCGTFVRYVVLLHTSGMWYFCQVCGIIPYLRYVVLLLTSGMWYFCQVCGINTYLRYVAETRVDRHIVALLQEEKLPVDNE